MKSFNKKYLNKTLLACAAFASIVLVGAGSSTSAQQACLSGTGTCNTSSNVTVTVTEGDICIGSDGALDLGSHSVSTSAQVVSWTFADYFWVEDMKGNNTGYYTTLQMSGALDGPWTETIAASNVAVKSDGNITTLSGSNNSNVTVDISTFTTLDNAVTYIKRDNGTNNGLIGKYGNKPELQLTIPAFQSVGQYTGTIVYTLIEN